jgi:uncharacterized membrane protein
MESMDAWKDAVKSQVAAKDYFEKTGRRWKKVLSGLSVMLLVIGLALAMGSGEIILGIVVAAAAIITWFISSKMDRRSKAAVEIYARCAALKNWLLDFSNLKEAVPNDVIVWNNFLVMAVVFGISKDVIKQLKITSPTLFEDPVFVPTWYWVGGYGMLGTSPVEAMNYSFNTAVSTATSQMSSSAGGGGGFSGGGGFGGGGGGGGGR